MLLKGLSYLEKIKCKNKNSPNKIDELVNLLLEAKRPANTYSQIDLM